MNIFEIKTNLQNIFKEIEDNEGELTPELAAELDSAEGSLKEKVEAYTAYIKTLENDINLIDAEAARLRKLKESKKKVIDKLKAIIIEVIQAYGETKKNGVKYIDYSTGSVSLRKSTSVEVDDVLMKTVITNLVDNIQWLAENNQLDAVTAINENDIIECVNTNFGVLPEGSVIEAADVNKINADITFRFPISQLFTGEAYNAIKNIVKYTSSYSMTPNVDKAELKKELQENGACAPNLARLQTNYNITIK